MCIQCDDSVSYISQQYLYHETNIIWKYSKHPCVQDISIKAVSARHTLL